MITSSAARAVNALGFEVVERKGIGHPDSLADLVAEEFSQRYARYGLRRFGVVPNHGVDKVALIGAVADVDFGCYRIDKPVSAYLFGKVTPAIGGDELPITEIFRAAVHSVLSDATGCPALLDHVRLRVENTSGSAADHPRAFYRPESIEDCRRALAELRANDTAFCGAYAPISRVEQLTIDLENFINSEDFRREFPLVGSDVKVMLVRAESDLNATVCLPFHPDLTDSDAAYQASLRAAHATLVDFARTIPDGPDANLNIAVNTKDRAKGAYLTPFGTSLGKGDCGLVGRGNRNNGVISSGRPVGVEALAGKNPLHHVGKLYTLLATRIADRIFDELGAENETVLVSRNGDPLAQPAFVGVTLTGRAGKRERSVIDEVVQHSLANLEALSKWLLITPPLDRFRHSRLVLEQ